MFATGAVLVLCFAMEKAPSNDAVERHLQVHMFENNKKYKCMQMANRQKEMKLNYPQGLIDRGRNWEKM